MKRALVATAALLVLAACGGSDKLDGDVTKKDVRAGYTYVQIIPMCTTTNKVTNCTPIPYIFTVPTCYRLYVLTAEGKKDDGCVEKSRWESVAVGSHYVGKDLGLQASKREQS